MNPLLTGFLSSLIAGLITTIDISKLRVYRCKFVICHIQADDLRKITALLSKFIEIKKNRKLNFRNYLEDFMGQKPHNK